MNLKTFIFGLLLSFGVPFILLVAVPYARMQALEVTQYDEILDETTGPFQVKTSGTLTQGLTVYNGNGCYHCHTRIIRPTYAGADMWHNDMAGVVGDEVLGDSRRESVVEDYAGEDFVSIGLSRNGPDLSNVGRRVLAYIKDTELTPEQWFYNFLQNPRALAGQQDNLCPAQPQLFELVPQYATQRTAAALPVRTEGDSQLIPTDDARALVSFLVSLKRDTALPKSRDLSPPEPVK